MWPCDEILPFTFINNLFFISQDFLFHTNLQLLNLANEMKGLHLLWRNLNAKYFFSNRRLSFWLNFFSSFKRLANPFRENFHVKFLEISILDTNLPESRLFISLSFYLMNLKFCSIFHVVGELDICLRDEREPANWRKNILESCYSIIFSANERKYLQYMWHVAIASA